MEELLRPDRLYDLISELVMCHSPSGAEAEIDRYLLAQFANLELEHWQDAAGNIVAKIPGPKNNPASNSAIAITAHKDEIGAIVKSINQYGQIEIGKLDGSFPWVYGEGIVDLLGDRETISAVLSFGSRHISHRSPQKELQTSKALSWDDAWLETKASPQKLAAAGIRPGTRMVISKHRKQPFRLSEDYVASYTLDNKASLAILLTLAEVIGQTNGQPKTDVYLLASANEEVGAIGAMYFSNQRSLDALIALEIIPLSCEYPIEDNDAPVLLSQDAYGVYDENLNRGIAQIAQDHKLALQFAVLNSFGSDGSIAMKFGHVPRAACLGFPTENTHGYEIAHLGAIANCIRLLYAYLK
ncbi:peptidase M42 family protein [Thalassoporum mexicanum PCC 7367]|uniref:M42 family metallopeptidase n=1 Tax=Thalassoporum mexicanum TaxID=3457544 RepID=UPI00029F973D|nr:M28 family peptidase [Pseudanabaena sp. PCC 7367]AFY70713.1 peptidase M42 family protein [Pseudanabaena sp. PCC 7367]